MSRLPISRRTLAIVAVLVGLAALLGYVALRSGPLAPVAVTVVKVETRALRPALFGVGNVEARQLYRIGPTAPGRLLRLGVEVGDTVKAGQVLGEMDPVDSDDRLRSQESVVKRTAATLADATARHAYAETQARRYEQLFAEKATSEELLAARRQDLQLAFAALTAVREDQSRAQSDLQALRAQRSSLRLVAPAAGVVTSRDVSPAPPRWRARRSSSSSIRSHCGSTPVSTKSAPAAWRRRSRHAWPCARAAARPWTARCCAPNCARMP